MLGPEHLARLLDLSRALSRAVEHAELAAIATEHARVVTGAAAAQITDDGSTRAFLT